MAIRAHVYSPKGSVFKTAQVPHRPLSVHSTVHGKWEPGVNLVQSTARKGTVHTTVQCSSP